MVKILFLTNDLGLGGVQRLTVDFANFINKNDFEPWVATLFSRPESFFYRDKLGSDIELRSFNFRAWWDLPNWWKFYRFLKKENFQIVFTQLFLSDFIGRICAWLAGTPVIVTEIQNIIPNLPKRYIIIDRLLRGITDVCISATGAVTEYAKTIIEFPPQKVAEIPTNAVDARRFNIQVDRKKVRAGLGIPEDAKVIISVGRLVEQKGHVFLIKAAPKVLAKEPNAYFLIAGSGRLQNQLQLEIDALGISERFKLLGDRKDIPELLMSSDIFAFPSIFEGQGLILFEAFFSKIPIVASNTGGIPDVIWHENTGLLVNPSDPDDLSESILRLLNNPAFAKKLAERALEKFGDRTMENSIKKLEALFKKLVRRQSA